MKLAAKEEAKTKQVSLEAPIPLVIIRAVFVIYLFFLLVVLPLAFHTGYNDIADTKWKVYMTFTVGVISDYGVMVLPGCAIILAALFLWLAIDAKRMGLKFAPPSATDVCVIAFMVITCISAILAPAKDVVLEGYPGYYMGLYAQVSFCALYLFSSHICLMPRDGVTVGQGKKRNAFEKFMLTDLYYDVIPWIVIALMMIGATPVMWTGIQNSLGRDMFHMAETSGIGVGAFASTIGNIGIYSEYITAMLPAGMYLFCYGKKWLWKLFGGAWLVLAFLASFSARAVAGFLGAIVVVFVFFVMGLRSFKQTSMWFASLAIFGLAARIAGTYQVDRGDGVMVGFGMERPAEILAGVRPSAAFIIFGIAGCAICALIQYLTDKNRKEAEPQKKRRFRISIIPQVIAVAAVLLAVYLVFWYIRHNTDGTLPAWLPASTDPMFVLSDSWGSWRLLIWRTVYDAFIESTEGMLRWRLFGIGPDNLYILPGMTDLGSIVWGANSIVAYAHNEVVNILVNMGFLGCAAYLGIFATAAITLIRNRRWRKASEEENAQLDATHDAPMRVIAIALLFGYFVQDFFGYQWVCITTAAFVIIGAGMGRYRIRNAPY